MFDARARVALDPALIRVAAVIDRPWVSPDRITLLGLALGLGSAATSAAALWWPALALWLVSRVCDGLDGRLARRRKVGASTDGSSAEGAPSDDESEAGGFLDITADFIVYGATVVGVAIGATSSFDLPWLPFLLVLFAYYVNGSAFLAFSSIAERTGRQIRDGRSLSFLGGLAEGAETIAIHSLWLIVPAHSAQIAWVWAAVIGVGAAHRVVAGYRSLR